MNSGSFQKGKTRIFDKYCQGCSELFFSRSGSRQFCEVCNQKRMICPECGGAKKRPYTQSCSKSCSSKRNFREHDSRKRQLEEARNSINRGKGISEARTGKPRLDMRGENNPNWKGGVSAEYKDIRSTLEYTNWRRAVFRRDDWTCQSCGERGGRLEAHHIVAFSHDSSLILEVDNGQTLCRECHKLTSNWGHRATKTNPKYREPI